MSLTWDEVERVLEARAAHVCLYGPPGTGKTHAAVRAANGGQLFALTLTEDTPVSEVRGAYLPVRGEFVWVDGPGLRAWADGGMLVLNEIDHAPGEALSFLLALLDSPESARLTLPTGETRRPAEGFVCVATMNGAPEDLPEALRDRFVFVECPDVHPGAVSAVPAEWREFAARTVTSAVDPARRLGIRGWLTLAALVEREVPLDLAARAVWGDRGRQVLDALSIRGE